MSISWEKKKNVIIKSNSLKTKSGDIIFYYHAIHRGKNCNNINILFFWG